MKIVCAGDCGVDNYFDIGSVKPGGISLNVAVHLKRLFSSTTVVTVVGVIGNDKNAEIVKHSLASNFIQNKLHETEGSTPVQYISNTVDGEKVFTKYDEGVLKNFTITDFQTTLINKSDLVIMPLFSQIEPFFKSAVSIKNKGITCVDFLDLSDFKNNIDVVEKYISYSDIAFFGLNINKQELINSLAKLSHKSGKLFVITLGKGGSIAFFNKQSFSADSREIKNVVDTTGAGDAFTAAFLKEFIKEKNIQKSLEAGNSYASRVVQHFGTF